MKIAVIGANGQLGTDICQQLRNNGDEVIALTRNEIDICQLDQVNTVLKEIKPDTIVNTAAYHHVEQCEANPDLAYRVNAVGAKNLAMVSNDVNAYLIHISTDYVFNGAQNEPYLESDVALPLNVYGNTKLAGELFIQAFAEKYLVLRTSGLYGKSPCRGKGGMNFVELMLKLGRERDEVRVVDNEVLTPTSTLEVARQIVRVSRPDIYGVAHATAECFCSWYQFAREIFELAKIETTLNIASPDEFPAKVPRPEYSVLENNLLKQYNLSTFKHWEAGLQEYMGV